MFSLLLVVPATPNMLKVVRVTADSATLQWFAPISDGGSPIKQYKISAKQSSYDYWEDVGTVNGRSVSYVQLF